MAIPITQLTNHRKITPGADHAKDNTPTEEGESLSKPSILFHATFTYTQIGDIMKLTGNTIFITSGGSGIGRALAEELHKRGNKVIISGRRKSHLDFVAKANPGVEAIELDIADPDSIKAVAKKLTTEHADLNVLVNNAGIMEPDQAAGIMDDRLLVSTVTTNLLGPIRLTSALGLSKSRKRGSQHDARQGPSRVERWPARSASRSTRETARPRGGGRWESTWDAFLRNAAARRFGGVAPDSPTRGQRVNGRSRIKWRNVSRRKSASEERTMTAV